MTPEFNNLKNSVDIVVQESIMKFRLSKIPLKSYLPDLYLQKKITLR